MSIYVYTRCLIFHNVFFGPLYIPYGIIVKCIHFPPFLNKEFYALLLAMLRERERERERDLGFQDKYASRERGI